MPYRSCRLPYRSCRFLLIYSNCAVYILATAHFPPKREVAVIMQKAVVNRFRAHVCASMHAAPPSLPRGHGIAQGFHTVSVPVILTV